MVFSEIGIVNNISYINTKSRAGIFGFARKIALIFSAFRFSILMYRTCKPFKFSRLEKHLYRKTAVQESMIY